MIVMILEKSSELLKEKYLEYNLLNARDFGNEIRFWIFDYPLEKELLIRKTVDEITQNLKKSLINVFLIDMGDGVKVNYAKFEGWWTRYD